MYKLWRRISPYEKSKHWAVRFWKILNTFVFITFTRIWFRSESMEKANQLLHKITHDFSFSIIPGVLWSYRLVFGVMAFGYFIHWIPERWKLHILNAFIRTPLWIKILIAVAAVFLIYQSWSSELQPFIYFQF